MKRYFAGLSRNSFLLAAASFFADTSTEMLYPVLPVFLTQTLHASGSIVGLIDGFAQALQNIVQGFSGTLADRLRRRKPIALAGFLLSAISKPLMGLATAWPALFGVRLLDRLGAGTRSAPRDALIAASVSEENRGRAFGLEGAGDNAGAFLGPLVTVLLLYALAVDIRSVFYLAVIPGLLALAMVFLVSERRTAVQADSKIDIGLRQFPRDYWKFLLVTALFGLGNSSNAFLILQTQDIGARRFVGRRHKQDLVESPGTAKCRIQMPRSVRRRQDQHPLVRRFGSVQFGQELIDQMPRGACLHVGPAGSQSVNLVEEQRARLMRPGVLE